MGRIELLPLDDRFGEYLHDESGLVGTAAAICFPESEEEIVQALALAAKEGLAVCVQGARTGLAGGAVPDGGVVLNLSRMKDIRPGRGADGLTVVDAGPGVTHAELHVAVARLDTAMPLFWPPDPTETSAMLGGAAACNARGLCSLAYGRVADHLAGVRVVHADGTVAEAAAGPGDMARYVGAEGCTGVFSSLRLRLSPRPAERWGLVFFFADEVAAAACVDALRSGRGETPDAWLAAIEFMDAATMALLRGEGGVASALKALPDFPHGASALVYLEIHARNPDAAETLAGTAMDAAAEAGSDPDTAWAATTEHEVGRLREMRHAVPETANRHVAALKRSLPEAVRLAADMSVADETFAASLSRYRVGLREAEVAGCVFGHAGTNRLDAVLLPADAGEYRRGAELLTRWAAETARLCGDVVGEYGIGRIKRGLYLANAPASELSRRRGDKTHLDPGCQLNPALAL